MCSIQIQRHVDSASEPNRRGRDRPKTRLIISLIDIQFLSPHQVPSASHTNMQGLLRTSTKVYPHYPLGQWLKDCTGTKQDGLYVTVSDRSLKSLKSQSRSWSSTTSQAEPLHSLDHSNVDLGELQSSPSRESGTWSDNHENRQARCGEAISRMSCLTRGPCRWASGE